MDNCEKAIFTNMCMIYDNNGNILVQDRLKPDWSGITFPGGHVYHKESFHEALIREIQEETGLTIEKPILCGVKQFITPNDERYVVFLYKTHLFSGSIKSSEEGKVFWIQRKDLENYRLAKDFEEMLKIFESNELNEFYYYEDFKLKLF